jgi:hypothetical protein
MVSKGMGSYTTLVVSCRLRRDTPQNIRNDLTLLLHGEGDIRVIEENAHRNPLCSTSAQAMSAWSLEETTHPHGWSLSVVSSVKNYHNEIELFLDWIEPYVEQGYGCTECWALVTGEEDVVPTIRYLRGEA